MKSIQDLFHVLREGAGPRLHLAPLKTVTVSIGNLWTSDTQVAEH